MLRPLTVFLICLFASSPLRAAELTLAVASNFAAPVKELSAQYQALTGHRLKIAYGSSGKMYAQIVNGAPFDVFLSADQDKAQRLVASGHAMATSRRTYAQGALVLWSAKPHYLDDGAERLRAGDFRKLAIANPRLAPYGRAAEQALLRLGIEERVRSRLVIGENIAQAYQFVYSGNADLGLVAASQIMSSDQRKGSIWPIPDNWHDPILQDLVILNRAADNAVALSWVDFLGSEQAREILLQYGYRAPGGSSS